MLVCLIEIVAVSLFLRRIFKRNELNQERHKNRCGYVYEELNHKNRGGWALTYPIFYQLRFLVLIFTVIFVENKTVVQVMMVSMSTIFIIALLGNVRPFIERKRNNAELVSEFAILSMIDLCLFSSDPALIPDDR